MKALKMQDMKMLEKSRDLLRYKETCQLSIVQVKADMAFGAVMK